MAQALDIVAGPLLAHLKDQPDALLFAGLIAEISLVTDQQDARAGRHVGVVGYVDPQTWQGLLLDPAMKDFNCLAAGRGRSHGVDLDANMLQLDGAHRLHPAPTPTALPSPSRVSFSPARRLQAWAASIKSPASSTR